MPCPSAASITMPDARFPCVLSWASNQRHPSYFLYYCPQTIVCMVSVAVPCVCACLDSLLRLSTTTTTTSTVSDTRRSVGCCCSPLRPPARRLCLFRPRRLQGARKSGNSGECQESRGAVIVDVNAVITGVLNSKATSTGIRSVAPRAAAREAGGIFGAYYPIF